MMYELKPTEYEKARPVFGTMDHHLAVNSIIEGLTPAKIYVDDLADPKAAITWTGHRFFLAGSEHNDAFNESVRVLFSETIYPQAIETGEDRLVLYYSPDGWEDKIEVILRDKHPIKAQRQFYAIRETKHDWKSLIPSSLEMRPVNRELLAEGHLKNLDALIEETQSERGSVEDFLSRSFGFCLVHGDEVVAWCLSEYNNGNRCEVGIETVEEHRRRGYATLTATALVEHALAHGVTQVGWHCYASNEPSAATALKVGFEKVRDYSVYLAWFDEEEQ